MCPAMAQISLRSVIRDFAGHSMDSEGSKAFLGGTAKTDPTAWIRRLICLCLAQCDLVGNVVPSRKHVYIILTPLNPTFI